MAKRSTRDKIIDNLLWLKWRLMVFFLVAVVSLGAYFSILLFRNEMRRYEVSALTDFDVLVQELQQIEDSERIIIENIDRFNSLVDNGVIGDEDRVALLENIRQIRERHNLFSIEVEVSEQSRMLLPYPPEVEFPDEQISLRTSRIEVQLPLLHEQDLARFLNDFLSTGRLILTNGCTMSRALLEPENYLDVVEHQLASCEFHWFTLQREPYTGV